MLIRSWIRIWVAIFFLLLFIIGITISGVAQQAGNFADNNQATLLRAEPAHAKIQQNVPIRLTLRIADGLTSTKIVTVPVLLQLTIQVNLSSELTAALAGPVIEIPAIVVMPAIPSPVPTNIPVKNTPIPTVIHQATVSPTTTLITRTELVTTSTNLSITPTPLAVTAPLTATTDPVGLIAPLCPDEGIVISSPGVYQSVSGKIVIRGTVQHEKFKSYKLEYTPGADVMQNKVDYVEFGNASKPVSNNVLGTLDTSQLPVGANTIRLTAFDQANQALPTCFVIVAVHH